MDNDAITALLPGLKNGNGEAWNLLTRLVGERLRHRLKLYGCSHHEAEDCVQEAYTELFGFLKKSHSSTKENVGGFLYTIAFRRATDLFRRRKCRKVASVDLPNEEISDVILKKAEAEHEKECERRESSEDIELMISLLPQLPESDQLIIRLWFFDGFSQREIAEMLAVSEGAVGVRLHRAKQRLADLFNQARRVTHIGN